MRRVFRVEAMKQHGIPKMNAAAKPDLNKFSHVNPTSVHGYPSVAKEKARGYSHCGLTGGPVCLRVLPMTTKWLNLEK